MINPLLRPLSVNLDKLLTRMDSEVAAVERVGQKNENNKRKLPKAIGDGKKSKYYCSIDLINLNID